MPPARRTSPPVRHRSPPPRRAALGTFRGGVKTKVVIGGGSRGAHCRPELSAGRRAGPADAGSSLSQTRDLQLPPQQPSPDSGGTGRQHRQVGKRGTGVFRRQMFVYGVGM